MGAVARVALGGIGGRRASTTVLPQTPCPQTNSTPKAFVAIDSKHQSKHSAPPSKPKKAFVAIDNKEPGDREVFSRFLSDPVHKALAACSEMRPAVDIFVGGEGSDVGVGAGGARTEYRSTAAKVGAA